MLSMLFKAFKKKRSLVEQVITIQEGDEHLRNEIIKSFKPFIAKSVSSVCKRYIYESDDEFSIGLIAFNEAIDKFSVDKGNSLIAFADTIIKRRVIDYMRSLGGKQSAVFEMFSNEGNEKGRSIEETKSLQEYEKYNEIEKRKEEILLFKKLLEDFGVSFSDLIKNSPKHEDARIGAMAIAKILVKDPEMNEILKLKKRLPIKQLETKVKVSRKTIERNRKYIIAVSIILNGDFLYLKDYIKGGFLE